VERPLRLNFHASPERLARLEDESAFQNLGVSKKRDAWAKSIEEADGRALQQAIRAMLTTLPEILFQDRDTFLKVLQQASKHAGLKLSASVHKAILSALAERDETAAICRDKDGHPEPDPELRDTESVPLTERIEDFFAREVQPHVPDAWINTAVRDEKDGEVGKVGYEINFNRYFYKYQPPRPLEEIEADIKTQEREILEMLREVAG
jgi:type I restriction enzyme M protein